MDSVEIKLKKKDWNTQEMDRHTNGHTDSVWCDFASLIGLIHLLHIWVQIHYW